jgi:hypothetical protein
MVEDTDKLISISYLKITLLGTSIRHLSLYGELE